MDSKVDRLRHIIGSVDDERDLIEAIKVIKQRTIELAHSQAQNAALREQFRQLTVAPCMSALLGYDLVGDCWCPSCRAKRALAAPTSGWPDMVVALVKAARRSQSAFSTKEMQASYDDIHTALAPFEGVGE